mgnify:FL=1
MKRPAAKNQDDRSWYTSGEVAKYVGVAKQTLAQWEKRKAAGNTRYQDFPVPERLAHSNHRIYTNEDIERLLEWKNSTILTTGPGV